MKPQAGILHLKSRVLNNTARQEELIKIFAKALPRFADFILIEDAAKLYGKHDLVADLLLSHGNTIFRHLDNLLVRQFIEIYQKVNNCGRPPENMDTVPLPLPLDCCAREK